LAIAGPDRSSAQGIVATIGRHRGTVVRSDDGVLATFDGPVRAIRCAQSVVGEVNRASPVRVGLHCGECEFIGNEISGVAVRIARQLAENAPASRIVVSQTVRDLVAGAGVPLDPYESHELVGLPGGWQNYLVSESRD
jgi:class 3 adenylate cyclase